MTRKANFLVRSLNASAFMIHHRASNQQSEISNQQFPPQGL
jgi:hypothetical protein